MKRKVRLSLNKETLAELCGDDLSGVAGAGATAAVTCYSCTCRSCLECVIEVGPSLPDTACMPEITFRTICR